MTTCKDIINYVEELAPPETAEEWDNVGLLCGSPEKKVERLMLCLDATSLVIGEAVEKKADLLISHHPLIFKSLKRIVEDDIKGRLLVRLVRNDISLYSAHTNLDLAKEGVNQKLAERLGLNDIKSLKESCIQKNCSAKGEKGTEKTAGFGKIGKLTEDLEVEDFIKALKLSLGARNVRLVGRPAGRIRNAAVFCGSFDDDLEALKRSGADILVTGDVKYHTAVDALEMGLCIADAGHFNSELVILPALAEYISKRFQNIQVFSSTVESDPFITY